MQESKSKKSWEAEASKREAEATSKETLEELEDEKASDASDSTNNEASKVPSPDGAFDDAKELKDADPM
jgi:hypothetical protein